MNLIIYYEEPTPYAVPGESGVVEGLTAKPVVEAFDKAGIPFQWKKMACGIGWFKKP